MGRSMRNAGRATATTTKRRGRRERGQDWDQRMIPLLLLPPPRSSSHSRPSSGALSYVKGEDPPPREEDAVHRF
jgi:hypothetical protein